ncbi:LamG-like jellyroll fold domain-containing protein [Methanolacinia petrolearia]|uniref:LamG-like jellyroll fold domain-containing protein n=1 Tax=Methanolacinia petrolearia TaxID=54120 RepID=UPI003BAB7EBF
MASGEPASEGSYISMSLDSLSWAQTSAAAAGLFTARIQFSVDAWVRFSGLPAHTVILGQENVFSFGNRASSIYFQFEGFDIILFDPGVSRLYDERWHYICATFDGSMVRLYIDGDFNTG